VVASPAAVFASAESRNFASARELRSRTMIFLDIAIVTAWLVGLVVLGLHLTRSD
jgi:hypothetical protein